MNNNIDELNKRSWNMSSTLPSVEKLDGCTDYSMWKLIMELYLIHEDYWEYVSTAPAATDIISCKKDQKAKAKICLMVKPHCIVHVHQAKTAKDAWDALKATFEKKGLNSRCSLKLEQFSTIRDYITTVKVAAQQLRDLGKEIDELLAALMIQDLTETFQPMRLAIKNTNVEFTTDYVKIKLFQVEDFYAAGPSNDANTL